MNTSLFVLEDRWYFDAVFGGLAAMVDSGYVLRLVQEMLGRLQPVSGRFLSLIADPSCSCQVVVGACVDENASSSS